VETGVDLFGTGFLFAKFQRIIFFDNNFVAKKLDNNNVVKYL
jgi:hypothetical protein